MSAKVVSEVARFEYNGIEYSTKEEAEAEVARDELRELVYGIVDDLARDALILRIEKEADRFISAINKLQGATS